jgi:hypothetical protein
MRFSVLNWFGVDKIELYPKRRADASEFFARPAMSDRLVTIATYHDPVAAALAKNFLASEEIPAVLFDESTVAVAWQLAGAIGGIKLQVAAIHVERAELLLAQIQAEKLADEDAEALPTTGFASPETVEELQAEAEDKEPINLLVDRMYRSAVFGLIFWPLQAYVLWQLVEVATMPGKVSTNRRWKVWVSVVLNLPILFVLCYLFSCIGGRRELRFLSLIPTENWSTKTSSNGENTGRFSHGCDLARHSRNHK